MVILTLGAIATGIGGFLSTFLETIFDHPLMAYFFILAGLIATSSIEGVSGFGLISAPITFVVSNPTPFGFGLHGFVITDFQILMVFVFFPLIALAIKKSKAM